MQTISEADVVLAIGTRLGPFGSLPQYSVDYWPKEAHIIQVEGTKQPKNPVKVSTWLLSSQQIDSNPRRLGLTKDIDIGICGDAKLASLELATLLKAKGGEVECLKSAEERLAKAAKAKETWEAELTSWSKTDEGAKRMAPREALRELEKALPKVCMQTMSLYEEKTNH